ncbi:hypothetical protein NQ315_002398 [Exocentrus adspersus]|uniref:Sperm-associated antigen 6 n=1 Tax=Exocentrus adspersus TaxID=1586481 RepID=A0AAV8VTA2_9CUCU|nr:hypothetical protein NQ315_002398 [Exocentrus adspersus]
MTSRSILQIFDQYQRARLTFVQAIGDLALKSQNTEVLEKAGVLELLRPLLCDICPQVVQCAAIALGRLVHHEASMAVLVITKNILPILLDTLHGGNKYQKQSILFVLRSICKHNVDCANAVIAAGGLQTFIVCLEDFEAGIKEAAAWGVGYIARQDIQLAQACVDAGAVPLLMLCLHEPEVSLKQIATSAISDVAKHSAGLAQNVVDTGVVPYLVKNLNNTDEKLKRQILTALSSFARHNSELAEIVVEAEIFPSVLLHLGHPCGLVRCNAARLVRDIVKHSLELTQLVVNTGGIGALMEMLYQNKDDSTGAKVAGVTALGYISGHADQLAMSVVGCKAIVLLAQILEESQDDALLSVTAWTLGQIGKHSPEHAQGVAAANVFPRLLTLYLDPKSSEDLRTKCKNSLKLCLQKCLLMSALEPLLYDSPPGILKYVLGQYSKSRWHDKVTLQLKLITVLQLILIRFGVETGRVRKCQSGFKEKLYINDKALCIVGDRIELEKQERPQRCYTNRNIKLASVETAGGEDSRPFKHHLKKADTCSTRKTFQLNSKEYKNLQVCNKQLRQIYETVEVEDFERILRNFYVSDEYKRREKARRTDDILAKIKPDEVYERFFGQHYAYLKHLISKNIYVYTAITLKCLQNIRYYCDKTENRIKSRDLDRKVLRETLYSEIFQRHRRSIFALGSFLRMLKTKKSNYNVLPQDPKARRLFVTSGGLRKVQEMDAKPGTTLYEYITVINSCFPEEIVRFYSPGYPETLLEKIEQYTPQMMTVLRETKIEDDQMQTEMEEETSSDEGNELRE